MKTTLPATLMGRFEKVGECLYRYSSNGAYYALLKHHGKQKRNSLEATDKAHAKRRLADLRQGLSRVDPAVGRITPQELCDRYLATIQNKILPRNDAKRTSSNASSRFSTHLRGSSATPALCYLRESCPSASPWQTTGSAENAGQALITNARRA